MKHYCQHITICTEQHQSDPLVSVHAGLTLSPSLTAVREASDEERSDGDQPADTALPAAAESRPASGYALTHPAPHHVSRLFDNAALELHICGAGSAFSLPCFIHMTNSKPKVMRAFGVQVCPGAQPVAGAVDAGGHPGERAAALRLLRPLGQHQPGALGITYHSVMAMTAG